MRKTHRHAGGYRSLDCLILTILVGPSLGAKSQNLSAQRGNLFVWAVFDRATVSAQRASGGPTGYPPAGDQPCAARCGRALIGGAPARRCTRLPLCQPRQRAGGAQSRSEETAGSQGAARARRKTDGKWPPHAASAEAACCGRVLALRASIPSRCALRNGLARTRACRGGAVTRPAEIAAAAAWGGEDGRA